MDKHCISVYMEKHHAVTDDHSQTRIQMDTSFTRLILTENYTQDIFINKSYMFLLSNTRSENIFISAFFFF